MKHVNIAKFLKTAFLWNNSGGCNTVHCNSNNQLDVLCRFLAFLRILFPQVVDEKKRVISLRYLLI